MTEADRLRLYKSNAESNRDAAEQRSKEAEDKMGLEEVSLGRILYYMFLTQHCSIHNKYQYDYPAD